MKKQITVAAIAAILSTGAAQAAPEKQPSTIKGQMAQEVTKSQRAVWAGLGGLFKAVKRGYERDRQAAKAAKSKKGGEKHE